jgi:glutamate 5-kinase
VPDPHPIRDRYFWLLHGLRPHGSIYIDEGAHRALAAKAGLLPVGVVDVSGNFAQQEAVSIFVVKRLAWPSYKSHTPSSSVSKAFPLPTSTEDLEGSTHTPQLWEGEPIEVGRALVNYSAAEIKRIKGLRATDISSVLGYADSEYVALRENVAFLKLERSRPVSPALGAAHSLTGVAVMDGGSITPRTP